MWQVLSPFYKVDMHAYAKMLWYRVLWHEQLGIHKMLLYSYECTTELLEEPLMQELMRSGRLQVVLFTDIPKHKKAFLKPHSTDIYALQVSCDICL